MDQMTIRELWQLIEVAGVPAVAAAVALWFIMLHIRSDRKHPEEPAWVAGLRRDHDTMCRKIEAIIQANNHRAEIIDRELKSQSEKLSSIKAVVNIIAGRSNEH